MHLGKCRKKRTLNTPPFVNERSEWKPGLLFSDVYGWWVGSPTPPPLPFFQGRSICFNPEFFFARCCGGGVDSPLNQAFPYSPADRCSRMAQRLSLCWDGDGKLPEPLALPSCACFAESQSKVKGLNSSALASVMFVQSIFLHVLTHFIQDMSPCFIPSIPSGCDQSQMMSNTSHFVCHRAPKNAKSARAFQMLTLPKLKSHYGAIIVQVEVKGPPPRGKFEFCILVNISRGFY